MTRPGGAVSSAAMARPRAFAPSLALLALACGGSPPPEPGNADTASGRDRGERGSGMAASAEIGALDAEAVEKRFGEAQGDLTACVHEGSKRNEYEGGDIAFFLKIDTEGRVVHAHAERSSLGDRATERCMLRALSRRSWPAPVGGLIGLARSGFGFDAPADVRPPTPWDGDRVAEAVRGVSGELSSCRSGVRGGQTATVYVDPDGAALSAGIASSDESGEAAADCVVGVLTKLRYPSPGSWPAKVTFEL